MMIAAPRSVIASGQALNTSHPAVVDQMSCI
jgi:hypothetical protein